VETDLTAAPAAAAAGEPAERGRYAIYQSDDGALVIPRATGLCESCSNCACGTQQEPLRVPGPLVKMARAAAERGGAGPAAMLKMLKAGAGR